MWPDGDPGDSVEPLIGEGGFCAPSGPLYDLPPITVPRGGVEYPMPPGLSPGEVRTMDGRPAFEEIPPDGDACEGDLVYDRGTGNLMVFTHAEWRPVEVKLAPAVATPPRTQTVHPTVGSVAYPVLNARATEICRVGVTHGPDGLPPEHVVMDGVEYDRVWSITEGDWVYA